MSGAHAPDPRWMSRALGLAEKGRGLVHPNPLVGAVLVRSDGKILGEGHHSAFGAPHAEAEAISAARALGATPEDLRDAALHVTLEPCDHHGKTSPCTEAILAAGIPAVHFALADPNRHGGGGGAARLRAAGVAVTEGTLADSARAQNAAYLKFAATGLPRITLKIASSLDGKIAAADATSRWITGEAARAAVDGMRRASDAVLVGVTTVLADDPGLRVRTPVEGLPTHDPLRVVLDTEARTPEESRLARENADGKTLLFAAEDLAAEAAVRAQRLGELVRVVRVPRAAARPGEAVARGLDLDRVRRFLAGEGKIDLLVEAGPRLLASFLIGDLVDRIALFQAPILLGGEGLGWTDALKIPSLALARRFRLLAVRPVGDDALLIVER